MTPASIIPVFGSQRPYADLNFAAGSFGLNGTSVSSLALLAGFTFTRASLAMMFDATGTLTYGPNNLLRQSQTLDNASWTKTLATVTADAGVAPDGTTTADKLIVNNGSSGGRAEQIVSAMVGTTYLLSAYVKPAGWNWVALRVAQDTASLVYFDVSTGAVGAVGSPWSNATITPVGDGWYRVSATYTALVTTYTWRIIPTNGNGGLSTGNGVDGVLVWGAQLEAVTYQTTPSTYYPTTTAAYYGPRLVYDPVTLAPQGILVEEARTNVCLQSSSFATTWAATNVTITSDATTAPDGTNTADKIEATTTAVASLNQIGAGGGSTSGSTGSVFAKQGSGATDCNRFTLRDNTAGTNLLQFTVNYSTGAITYSIGSSGVTVTNVGNGWWRIAATAAAASNGNNIRLYVGFDGGAETAGEFAYFWGAQIEAGTGASSPIPTTTASVTRAADVATVTGLSMPYPLSMVSTFQRDIDTGASQQTIAQVDTGAPANRFNLYISSADLLTSLGRGGVNGGDASVAGATVAGVTYTGAARALQNSFIAARSGTLSTLDSAFDYPATAARLGIGNADSSNQLNGTISRIRIYNRALSDAELQAITT